MSDKTAFVEAVELIIRDNEKLIITEGTVDSVDKIANTCIVKRDELAMLFKVRLNAVLDPGKNTITVYPKKGSKVLCAIIENNVNDAFVLSATEIDEIIINGGELGGLIKISELEAKLNKLVQEVNSMKNVFNAHVHTTTATIGTGSVGVISSPTSQANAVSEFSKADFENEKIKH